MRHVDDSARCPWVLLILAILCLGEPALTASAEMRTSLSPMLAQMEGVAPDNSEAGNPQTEPAGTSASLPHLKFLWDYLLALALLAGAIYAVCRSSRRV